jgi:hypothetical protein
MTDCESSLLTGVLEALGGALLGLLSVSVPLMVLILF